PEQAALAGRSRPLHAGATLDVDEFSEWLVEHGYQRVDTVELPGDFSRRGGILDVYSPDAEAPYRVELFGDEVESIRQFAADTQRSLGELHQIEITAAQAQGSLPLGLGGHLCEYLRPDSWTALVEPEDLAEQAKHYLEREADVRGLFSIP